MLEKRREFASADLTYFFQRDVFVFYANLLSGPFRAASIFVRYPALLSPSTHLGIIHSLPLFSFSWIFLVSPILPARRKDHFAQNEYFGIEGNIFFRIDGMPRRQPTDLNFMAQVAAQQTAELSSGCTMASTPKKSGRTYGTGTA